MRNDERKLILPWEEERKVPLPAQVIFVIILVVSGVAFSMNECGEMLDGEEIGESK